MPVTLSGSLQTLIIVDMNNFQMRGARMGLMNSAMHRSSPGKSQTPTSGPLLPSNMSMQQSFGRGGGRGGGVRQNLYGIKHSAEENSPPPEYANNIPTLQKHARYCFGNLAHFLQSLKMN